MNTPPKHDYTCLEWRHGKWYVWYMIRENDGVSVGFEELDPQPEPPKL